MDSMEVAINMDYVDGPLRPGPVIYDYGHYTIIPYIIGIILIISIIVSILKKNRKNIVISCIFGLFGLGMYKFGKSIAKSRTPMLGLSTPGVTRIIIQYPVISKILIIISIITQLIPFIICLKNNKKVKKDEVKQ